MTRDEIMQKLGLKGGDNFQATYLYPAIEQGSSCILLTIVNT
jgi:hypothetical protein